MKRTWHFVVPVLMIVLLTITTVGMVCHHHDGANPANCTLCHMALEPALNGAGHGEFVLQHAVAVSQPETILVRWSITEISPRAPPA